MATIEHNQKELDGKNGSVNSFSLDNIIIAAKEFDFDNINVNNIINIDGDHYQLSKKLGEGGNGYVFVATPIRHGKTLNEYACVVKIPKCIVYPPESHFNNHTPEEREEELANTLKPHVEDAEKQAEKLTNQYEAKVYVITDKNGKKIPITMIPLLAGEPLAGPVDSNSQQNNNYKLSKEIEKLSLSERLKLASFVAQTYYQFHAKGLLHSDLDSLNILIEIVRDKETKRAQEVEVTIIDFADTAISSTSCPPERVRYYDNTVDGITSDDYSLCFPMALIFGGKNVSSDKLSAGSRASAANTRYKFDEMVKYLDDEVATMGLELAQEEEQLLQQEINNVKEIIIAMGEQEADNRLIIGGRRVNDEEIDTIVGGIKIDEIDIIEELARVAKVCEQFELQILQKKDKTATIPPVTLVQNYRRIPYLQLKEEEEDKEVRESLLQFSDNLETVMNELEGEMKNNDKSINVSKNKTNKIKLEQTNYISGLIVLGCEAQQQELNRLLNAKTKLKREVLRTQEESLSSKMTSIYDDDKISKHRHLHKKLANRIHNLFKRLTAPLRKGNAKKEQNKNNSMINNKNTLFCKTNRQKIAKKKIDKLNKKFSEPQGSTNKPSRERRNSI